MPENEKTPWVVAPDKKDQRPIVLSAKPAQSATERAWVICMVLIYASMLASIWLAAFNIMEGKFIVLFLVLVVITGMLAPHK